MTGQGDGGAANWGKASRQWSLLASPLRPDAGDVAFAEAAIADWFAANGRPPRALVLGVTPELTACAWPAGTRLVAIDNSWAMIDALWPAPGVPAGARVLCADWRAMPLPDAAIDVVVGDGCYSAAPFRDAATISREVARVLAPGGVFAIRTFGSPDQREDLEELFRAIVEGRVGNVHALKWRLAAIVQPRVEEGARLGDIWTAFQALRPAIARVEGGPGWTVAELGTLDRYRDNDLRYCFPTEGEFRAVTGPWLVEEGRSHGTYPLAERCLRYRFRRR
ncbi:class I SAM-dependent methyltransferase [Stella sp.]|uniref:class I SAM-dependent methyltransferase n=1 Tax=Stella sp. TaxID=2912054 RepID=UPI0035B2EA41